MADIAVADRADVFNAAGLDLDHVAAHADDLVRVEIRARMVAVHRTGAWFDVVNGLLGFFVVLIFLVLLVLITFVILVGFFGGIRNRARGGLLRRCLVGTGGVHGCVDVRSGVGSRIAGAAGARGGPGDGGERERDRDCRARPWTCRRTLKTVFHELTSN